MALQPSDALEFPESLFRLTCESYPAYVQVNEPFKIHFWAQYNPQDDSIVFCQRDLAAANTTGDFYLTGTLAATEPGPHSLIFRDLEFGDDAAGQSVELSFRLVVNGQPADIETIKIHIAPLPARRT